jgi:hypothetical protein
MRCLNTRKAYREVGGTKFPYTHPCGYCKSCRINKREEWVLRMVLEYRQTPETYFVTLTYKQEDLPWSEPDDQGVIAPTLDKTDVQRFFKRLRKRVPGTQSIRYFLAGEYCAGHRPHYHALVYVNGKFPIKTDKHFNVIDSPVHQAWYCDTRVDCIPLLGEDDATKVARYIGGYIVKHANTPERAERHFNDGRLPEFSVQSRRPGIGFTAVEALADATRRKGILRDGSALVSGHTGDRLDTHLLRVGRKKLNMGRRLREKFLDALGTDDRSEISKAIDLQSKMVAKALSQDTDVELLQNLEDYHRATKKEIQHVRSKALPRPNRPR